MARLIIAGLPTSVTNRHKGYVPQVPDWCIQVVASRDSRKPDLRSCWKEVLAAASEDGQGTHVFAYHHQEDEYPKFNKEMHDRHRLVWMDRHTLIDYGSGTYTQMIEDHLDFESRWRDKLRPRGVDAPGILPESSFSPKQYEDMWSRIRSVGVRKDDLERVLTLVRGFRKTHYDNGRWVDSRGLQFKVASALHGSNSQYGSFKFTFRFPDGFHYDVSGKIPNHDFTVKDAEGRPHPFGRYTNVDPHGSIRGGK